MSLSEEQVVLRYWRSEEYSARRTLEVLESVPSHGSLEVRETLDEAIGNLRSLLVSAENGVRDSERRVARAGVPA